MATPPADFMRLVALGRKLKRKGWELLAIHSSSARLRRRFSAGGRDWQMGLNPSVHPSSALLNLWFVPDPAPKTGDWKKTDRTPFCAALDRKMRHLRFLKVFGCESGGRILFFKRLTSFGQIVQDWKRLAEIPMETLDRQRIPDSSPVRGPVGSVRGALRDRVLQALVKQVQRNRFGSSHFRVGLRRKVKAAGHRWSVDFGIYWQRYPRDVEPPSTFWASLMIYPHSGFTRKDRVALERIGFYSRVARSLRHRRFQGSWHDLLGGFADFSRHRLRWKDIAALCEEIQAWSLQGALAEMATKGKPERIRPVKSYRK